MKATFSKNIKKDRATIDKLLTKYNQQFSPKDDHKEFAISLEDKGKVVGGLKGDTFWGWLYVDMLFVPEEHRGKGYGEKLMKMAEAYAKKQKCHSAELMTHDFQAPGFYKKLGYKVVGQLKDLPKGHIRYLMFKSL